MSFVILEGFGLDIVVFIQKEERHFVKFIEVKTFVGSRGGGVGFGNGSGRGSQVDLLISAMSEPSITEPHIRWVLGNGSLPKGSARYAIFTTSQANEASMGGVARGKQNNHRVSDFQYKMISWEDLVLRIDQFLLK